MPLSRGVARGCTNLQSACEPRGGGQQSSSYLLTSGVAIDKEAVLPSVIHPPFWYIISNTDNYLPSAFGNVRDNRFSLTVRCFREAVHAKVFLCMMIPLPSRPIPLTRGNMPAAAGPESYCGMPCCCSWSPDDARSEAHTAAVSVTTSSPYCI